VQLDETQVAAIRQGAVKVLREMRYYKNKKFFTNMFVSVQQQMLTSKITRAM